MSSSETDMERKRVYKDRKLQHLLLKLANKEITEITPVYDLVQGFKYLEVEEILGKETNKIVPILQKLAEIGILEKKIKDKIIRCPTCNSPNTSTYYLCPYCGSLNVEKQVLLEHVRCGTFNLEKFFRKNGELICPKCGLKLEKAGSDYRKAGVWFECEDCKRRFATPPPTHRCRNCGKTYSIEDSSYESVYSYVLSKVAEEEIKGGIVFFLTSVAGFFEKHKFEVESPGFLKGESGVTHEFDVVAKKAEKGRIKETVAVDIAFTNSTVTEFQILQLYAKILDIKNVKSLLVAVPKMNDEGKRLASVYKIDVIEAKDSDEVLEKLGLIFK